MSALNNEMICGTYRGNPNYCEPYITRQEFDALQKVIKRNPRTSPSEYTYIFAGLIRCPDCGCRLSGSVVHNNHSRNNKNYKYYGYRCPKNNKSKTCAFKTVAFEKRMELELLANLERIVNDKKMHVLKAREGEKRIGCHDVAELQKELERVNYAWRKGRIKSVEEYDAQYDELMQKIEEANAEEAELHEGPDYEKIQQTLSDDWKGIYQSMDAEHKRAFWRSFVEEIRIEWTKDVKRVSDILFF